MNGITPNLDGLLILLMDSLFPEDVNPAFKEFKNELIRSKAYTLDFVDLYGVGHVGDGGWQLRFRIRHSGNTVRLFKWTEAFNQGDLVGIESYIKHKAPSIILSHYASNLHWKFNDADSYLETEL